MSFQWLQMRITEEQERRDREAQILASLPRVLEEVRESIAVCVENYKESFGSESIEMLQQGLKIRVTVREELEGRWEMAGKVEITVIPKLPGLHIDRNGDPLEIEVGLLPGEKTFYKDVEEFLTMEELTRRILDRTLFPKLGE
jgi:hypothetical protein